MSKEFKVESVNVDTEKKSCKSCEKGLNSGQKWTIVLGLYMLGSSIYGTVELVKSLISLF